MVDRGFLDPALPGGLRDRRSPRQRVRNSQRGDVCAVGGLAFVFGCAPWPCGPVSRSAWFRRLGRWRLRRCRSSRWSSLTTPSGGDGATHAGPELCCWSPLPFSLMNRVLGQDSDQEGDDRQRHAPRRRAPRADREGGQRRTRIRSAGRESRPGVPRCTEWSVCVCPRAPTSACWEYRSAGALQCHPPRGGPHTGPRLLRLTAFGDPCPRTDPEDGEWRSRTSGAPFMTANQIVTATARTRAPRRRTSFQRSW